MDFIESNTRYEFWLRRQMPVIENDLTMKHEKMKESPFLFLRGTYFRWCEHWQENMDAFTKAPRIMAVGDLHIENFGTWRDQEGRLIWGINDFDEAGTMPYAIDIVRLAASAVVASSCEHLNLSCKQIVKTILEAYEASLKSGGRAFVLEEEHSFLREIATQALRDPKHFFARLDSKFPSDLKTPAEIKKILIRHLPAGSRVLGFAHRSAGLGSLGRPRFIVSAELNGGRIVRETKALCGRGGDYKKIIDSAVRMPDPILHLEKNWVTRRLAPHCTKIEMSGLQRIRDELKLVYAMGFELGNIHARRRASILKDLIQRKRGDWIEAVNLMVELTIKDWHEWVRA